MSRDWTPRESLAFEQLNISRGFGDMWDFMENLVINYNDKSERAYSDEEIALRKQFPTLGKLLNNFSELHEALSAFDGGLELLQEKDRDLAGYIETEACDKDSYLVKWFEGELDPHFHYREYNDQLLVARMCEEALQKGLSNWVLTDPDCLQVRRQTGFEGRGVFELIQIVQIPDSTDPKKRGSYLIADGEIDLDDYTQEEINSALDGFGYDDMRSLVQAAGSRNEACGQLAEMLFELSTSFYTMRFSSWDEALEHIEYRTGKDWSKYRENTCESLAARLVDFYKGYDLYDYRDSLAPGATDEEAIHYIEKQLRDPASVDGILEALEEFAEDPDLDKEQIEEIADLMTDVKAVKQELETATNKKKPLEEQIQSASEKINSSNAGHENKINDLGRG